MSGTSEDGIDAVLADLSGSTIRVRSSSFVPFSAQLRDRLQGLRKDKPGTLVTSKSLEVQLAHLYAKSVSMALAKVNVSAKQVSAIGCHGQTIFHRPDLGWSMQLNNPSLLAELTGITVVSDFRARDIAAGGSGAPLVPAFHDAAFQHPSFHRAIVNVGGIANLTDLKPGKSATGFDIGPGNTLMDAWIKKHKKKTFDKGGRWARSGVVIPQLLTRLLADPYFKKTPPKSTGLEYFNLRWLARSLKPNYRTCDVQATLLSLTATTIARAIQKYSAGVDEVYLCGGGALNTELYSRLAELLHSTGSARLALTDELGVSVKHVEALAFAWLAKQTLAQKPGNLSRVTGARGKRILGGIYLK